MFRAVQVQHAVIYNLAHDSGLDQVHGYLADHKESGKDGVGEVGFNIFPHGLFLFGPALIFPAPVSPSAALPSIASIHPLIAAGPIRMDFIQQAQ